MIFQGVCGWGGRLPLPGENELLLNPIQHVLRRNNNR